MHTNEVENIKFWKIFELGGRQVQSGNFSIFARYSWKIFRRSHLQLTNKLFIFQLKFSKSRESNVTFLESEENNGKNGLHWYVRRQRGRDMPLILSQPEQSLPRMKTSSNIYCNKRRVNIASNSYINVNNFRVWRSTIIDQIKNSNLCNGYQLSFSIELRDSNMNYGS